ncbi:MAG: YihY/virulence factor BrkB family protein [Actinomycetota bacterium]
MTLATAVDRFQRRHRWAGFPVAVLYKFVDDQGTYLAAMITYYGFLSLFPMLLLFVSILGYALHGDPHLQRRVLDSALTQFPVVGDDLARNISALHGSTLAIIIGIAGSLYGGLGVIQAIQNAMNKIWAVPRGDRPNVFKARLLSLLVLLVVGTGFLFTTVLSALSAGAQSFGANLGAGVRLISIVVAAAINALLFIVVFRMLTAREISFRQVRSGAIAAALIWQVLQLVGGYYVGHKLRGAGATYGVFGLVLGLLAWIYLETLTIILCAEANAVRVNKLWPRNLLAPFSDDVALTDADRRAYASYPPTEKHKPFENVDVDFDPPGTDDRAT